MTSELIKQTVKIISSENSGETPVDLISPGKNDRVKPIENIQITVIDSDKRMIRVECLKKIFIVVGI